MRISDWSSDVCSSDLPFTPVPGPRLLLRDAALAPALIAGIEAVVDQHGLSSAHASFVAPDQVPLFEAAGRSEERRVGTELVSTCRLRWSTHHSQKHLNHLTYQYTHASTTISEY